MEEIHYYVNNWDTYILSKSKDWWRTQWRGKEYLLEIRYETSAKRKVCKKGLFFSYEEWEDCKVPANTYIPLLLYGDGENFYEFFSKQFFGKRMSDNDIFGRNYKFNSSHVPVSHTLFSFVKTTSWEREEYGPNTWHSTIKEYSAVDFLSMVKEVLEHVAPKGIDSQHLKEEITMLFSIHSGEVEVAAARAEREESERKAEEVRKEEEASAILQEMMK